MKKVITLALVLCIILGCVPAFATGYETEVNGITYIVADGEATVKSCKWEVSGNVSVESEIDGCPVTKIGERAFENCGQIKNITIPDSVKVIEKEAFNRCVNLQEVLGMKNVETIGERAFNLCDFESFTMPEKVTRIEYGTFMDNKFEKFETGNSVTFIDDSAFRGSVWLAEVIIGDAVTEIGTAATGCANEDFISKNYINERTPVFQGCSSLKTITLGKSVRYVYPNTFLNLNKLENIFVSEENPYLKSIDGVLFTKDGKTLVCYPRAKTNTEYTIPDGVETIDDKAFYNCDTEKVNAPESLKRVGIYNAVLDDCTNVERMVTKGKQGNIDWVYDNGVLTFTGNGTLTDTFSGTVVYPTWEWNKVKKIVVNEGITEVDGMAGHKNVTEIVLPKTLEKIGGRAFANCDSLESIVIPENVSKIDVMAFDECENLREVVVTSKVPLTIGRSAFYIAEGARVYLPETVYQIDELAFSYTWGVMGGYGVGPLVEKLTIIAPYGCPAYTWATKKGINVETGAPQTEITIMVNGVKLNCDSTPYIKNDRTMVPMRAIFEALGATVTWDDETKTATGIKGRIEVKITIGENVLYKNGEAIELDCAAEITNDRTMVPVRAISEAFNATVSWDNETKTVEINLN